MGIFAVVILFDVHVRRSDYTARGCQVISDYRSEECMKGDDLNLIVDIIVAFGWRF
jgi:hypothetical protein